MIRTAAAELPAISLEDALSICHLLARQVLRHFERAALRWIGRYCLERGDLRGLEPVDLGEITTPEVHRGLPRRPAASTPGRDAVGELR